METVSTLLDPHSTVNIHTTTVPSIETEDTSKNPDDSGDENEADSTVHGFNISNVTVIERPYHSLEIEPRHLKKLGACEGSDSGVEVVEIVDICLYQRNLSSNSGTSQDFDNLNSTRSCDSSIISCCSNYEEAYNLLVRKNSTLLEDYHRNEDITSENGSESSSISGSQLRSTRRIALNGTKKKISAAEGRNKSSATKDRSRSKPPVNPKTSNGLYRIKSIDRTQSKTATGQSTKTSGPRTKATPPNLDLHGASKRDSKNPSSTAVRASSSSRTPTSTPTDDGRWPSVNSKPAPLMSRSLKGQIDVPRQRITQLDTKTIEKYATLPRQKKDKSSDNNKDAKKPSSRENTVHRIALTKKSSRENTPSKTTNSAYLPKNKQKTKIYHECCCQTVLTMSDVENALTGVTVTPRSPCDLETCDKDVQVDISVREIEKLQDRLCQLNEKYEGLQNEHRKQTEKLKETENKLREECLEKKGLCEELQNNSHRVLAILGGESDANLDTSTSSDSLLVLETRFQNVGQVVIKQEEEISKLNSLCRSLQLELEKSLEAQRALVQQQQDVEAESLELQEFMQAEKMTLHDVLKESEVELQRHQMAILQKNEELAKKQEECKQLVKLSEQRRQENVSLQARLTVLESKSRELLVHQGSSVSGAAVALSALIGRLDGLVEELVIGYSISDQELEDVIFHNEAYKNSSSSPESTPEKTSKCVDKSPSPQKGSSFVSAVINAIKSAAQSPFAMRDGSKDRHSNEQSSSNEMIDSETEPCLMMEHVLEDVIIPDGHSHNLVSSGHGSMISSHLTHSESLKDLSQAILHRQMSDQTSLSFCGSLNNSLTASDILSINDLFPSVSLVDQVIDVDNLITRLLKVIRIIQLENDDCMNELQEQKESLSEQIERQKETNKVVVKQLKDWEVLGAKLKFEVKDLMAQKSKKNTEIDNLKTDLNKQREEIEKLNQDVCELSTTLAKAELETKVKEEEVTAEMKKWEKTGELPAPEILARLVSTQNEIPILKQQLIDKEKHLKELTQEFLESRQVLSESLKDALSESKKQYDAIDNVLEVLNSIQSVVQQCPPLTKLQRDLEEISFQSASAMPSSDCNALLQAVANLEITPTINTTA